MIKKIALLAATGAVAATTVWAAGHSSPEGQAVKARQAHMQLYQFNAGLLGGMARGNVDYDAEAAAAAASNLAALANMAQAAYWPMGSDSDSIDGSRALPSLWENFPTAAGYGADLAAAATALAATAGDGVEAVQAGIGPIFGACSACHKEFRQSQ